MGFLTTTRRRDLDRHSVREKKPVDGYREASLRGRVSRNVVVDWRQRTEGNEFMKLQKSWREVVERV